MANEYQAVGMHAHEELGINWCHLSEYIGNRSLHLEHKAGFKVEQSIG